MKANDSVFILGFGLAGYRSFGPELQRIGPCQKINLFIGQNNCGKSNILRFISDHYKNLSGIVGGGEWRLKDLEKYRSLETFPSQLSLAVAVTEEHLGRWQEEMGKRGHRNEIEFQTLVNTLSIDPCGDGFWIHSTVPASEGRARFEEKFLAPLESLPDIGPFCQRLLMTLRGGAVAYMPHVLLDTLRWLIGQVARPVECVKIPPLRIPGTHELKADFSGADIIHRIARLQNPDHDKQEMGEDFRRIERLLQYVTDHADARLEVPYNRNTITVHMDGRSMPLEALGTGVHEVIILAAAATVLHEHVICIEEPEVHLHPLLQKKLLRYLDEKTDNQYFISTHSAHLLDHPGAAIFHVRLTDHGSVVEAATEATKRFAICTDLGYRASDLLQTNCVIWVEGPSDRIYLREWIGCSVPALVEGIDYSIMFYGGRLLSHLSPNDPDVTDFISLRRLNRNMVIVMDSDKENPDAAINATKGRIVEAWAGQSGFAWVTQGREIENYVEPDSMLEAKRTVAPTKEHQREDSPYNRCISKDAGGNAVADKVKVAHWLSDNKKLTLSRLDLGEKIHKLCDFIRAANHVPTGKGVTHPC